MPFTSKAQQKFMFAKKPALAKEFARGMKPSDFTALPNYSKKKKKKPAFSLAAESARTGKNSWTS